MLYPLDNYTKLPRGFKFGQIYPPGFGSLTGKPHIGIDIILPVGGILRAPCNGIASFSVGPQGGNTITIVSKSGEVIRLLHLNKYVKLGAVSAGEIIGETGGAPGAVGSGTSTAPHLHLDVKVNGQYVDPELHFMPEPIPLTIIGADIPGLKQEVEKWSKGFFTVDIKNVPQYIPYVPGQDYEPYINGQGRYCIVSCNPGPQIYKTTMPNSLEQAYAIGGTSALACAYEVSHMLHKFYLAHRGVNPYIDIEDTLNPSDEQRYRKYDVMKPYTGIILGSDTVQEMFELRQVVGSPEVWLIRDYVVNGVVSKKKTHIYNANALLTISDFSSIKPITDAELNAIPDSGLDLATLTRE